MEKNNFTRAYVYIIAIFAIGIAISNIISFFNGVGFALIGTGLLLTLSIVNILKDENNKKRFGDIFILIALEFMLLIVLFFAYDFNINGMSSKFPLVIRNICAIYSMLAFAYVMFRYISEVKGKKYNFVEYMLGNYVPEAKEKKAKPSKEEIKKNKELENGTLEPKPSSIENTNNFTMKEESTVQSKDSEVVEENIVDNKDTTLDEKTTDNVDNTTNINTTNRTGIWY